jgi:hypothetical protein
MDQLRALVALFPEMLQDRRKPSRGSCRQRVGMDVLCGYEHGILPRHARRKGCAHKPNELFQVIACVASVIRDRDLLHRVISTPTWI